MGPDNLTPLDELRELDRKAQETSDLAGLKPLFARVDQIGMKHPADLDVQLAVTEIKQHILQRGAVLRKMETGPEPPLASPPPAPPPDPKAEAANAVAAKPFDPAETLVLPPGAQPAPPAKAATPSSTAPSTAPPASAAVSPSSSKPVPATPPSSPKAGPPLTSPPRATNLPPPAPKPLGKPGKAGWIFAVAAVLLILVGAGFFWDQQRKRDLVKPVAVRIVSIPPGAAIRVNGDPKCAGDCNITLAPGKYQVTAFLDGYQAAASEITIVSQQPSSITVPLTPEPQVIRILTDLKEGQVTLDDQAALDLQEGQLVMDRVAAGHHTLKVSSKIGEANFSLDLADAKLPVITEALRARNLTAIAVSSLADKAHIYTNGPTTLTLNGLEQPSSGPEGADLTGFHAGVNEIVAGVGKDQRNVKESFGPGPMFTAFLKSDLNIGTLIISTGEDDTRVFLNGKEYPKKTARGEIRLQTLGNLTVRVAKDGFEMPPAQTADVRKGSEVRLEFKLQAQPKTAVLQIRGGTPQAEVFLDDRRLGAVGDDGNFSAGNIPVGDHAVELRRDQFSPRRVMRTFRAGQTIAIAGSDVVLAAAVGTVRIARTPADAAVTYRRADDSQTHELRAPQVDLPAGAYVFTAKAPGFQDRSERVQIAVGETKALELTLAKVAAPAPAAPKTLGIEGFETAGAWTQQGDVWLHKGAGFIPYKAAERGTYTFTIQLLKGGNLFRGGRIRWAVQYKDGKNYDLFELDRKTLVSKVIIKGETFERGKYDHKLADKDRSYTVQVEIAQDRLIHRILKDGAWVVLDTWAEPGRVFTDGQFGFLFQGNDEVALSDFKFSPK